MEVEDLKSYYDDVQEVRVRERFEAGQKLLLGTELVTQEPLPEPLPNIPKNPAVTLGALAIKDSKGLWHERRACNGVDPDVFFNTSRESREMAEDLCRSCEVMPECREYAIANARIKGFAGGTSHRERVRIRQQRIDADAQASQQASE